MTIDRFGEFLQRPARRDDLTDDGAISGFLSSRLADGLADHTVDKERDKLLALAQFAALRRHTATFPDVAPIKITQCSPRAMQLEQLNGFLRACLETDGMIGGAPAGFWWHAHAVVGVTTGERTEAMLALRWDWIDDGNRLRVPGSVRKAGKPAVYDLCPFAATSLGRLRGFTLGKIFAWPWCIGTYYNHYDKILIRAGLPPDRYWKMQCLRRTFASYLEAAGGDATEALQHSSRKTTKASYLDPTIVGVRPTGHMVADKLGLVT